MLGFIIFASKHYTCPVLQLNHGLSQSKFHISWFKRSHSKVPHLRRWRYHQCWCWFTLAQKDRFIYAWNNWHGAKCKLNIANSKDHKDWPKKKSLVKEWWRNLFSPLCACMHQNDHNSKKRRRLKKLTLCLGLTQPKKVWKKDLQKKTWNSNIYKALTNQAPTSYNNELYFDWRKKMSSG